MSIVLFEHNLKAYKKALDMLSVSGKAAIIHPTGTGKSFIGFRLAEDNKDKKILWLSPSEYIVKTQLENLKRESDCVLSNIEFITYAKLMFMSSEEIEAIKPDFIIMDEFHRCGAEKWGQGIETLMSTYSNIKMLGLSATNIRYLDNQRDMADEIFEGNIASYMTLGDAIVRGILPAPKYVISVYSYEKEIEKYRDRVDKISNLGLRRKTQEELEALCRALEKSEGLSKIFKKHIENKSGKYIVFCSDYEHMEEMINRSQEWFGDVNGNMKIYRAYSKNTETEIEFEGFKADKSDSLKLLYCIDMLNEGVHVDDVDGVVLFRPTISPIVYKQQIGRALSTGNNRVPIIFDVVNNFDNLYSIATIQDEMNLAVSYYREIGESRYVVNRNFNIYDETCDAGSLFKAVERSLSASWDIYFEAARTYFDEKGNLNVPKKYVTDEGLTLGMWINTQRRVRNGSAEGVLTNERINKLNSIGMIWDNVHEIRWEKGFEEAKAYFDKMGNLDVKADYKTESGFALGKWISQNRERYNNKSHANLLSDDRVKRLENIGMIWSKNNMVWEKNYIVATEYYLKNGNIDVNNSFVTEKGIKLGAWLDRQRKLKEKNELCKEQIERLDLIGMKWESRQALKWRKAYDIAKKYFEENGSLEMPISYVTEGGFKLGKWIYNQRGNKNLSRERKELLARLNMKWDKNSWEERFLLAKDYFEKNGNIDISTAYKTENNIWLGKWINEQRKIYRGLIDGEKLSSEQIKRLEEIGMEWRTKAERLWDKRYDEVLKYFEKYGNVDIPKNYISDGGCNLFSWLRNQYKKLAENKLNDEQVEKLKILTERKSSIA